MGRLYERSKLNTSLISAPTNFLGGLLPGVPPWPSPSVTDVGISPGVPSGTFQNGLPRRPDPPSWTRAYMGTNQAFVINDLRSGNEDLAFNTFSGSAESLELSPVPATSKTHYSKEQRLQTITVKKTASFFDTLVPTVGGIPISGVFVPSTFTAGFGSYINAVTSSNGLFKATPTSPAMISIPVNVTGRLVDIKVWLEIVHVSSSATTFPLGMLGVALRNPNLSWGVAHPIMNDPIAFAADSGRFREASGEIKDFYRSSFLLWEGGSVFNGNLETGPQGGTVSNGSWNGFQDGPEGSTFTRYPTWHKDRGMRTVFADSSRIMNPRTLYSTNVSGNYIGAPNSYPGTGSDAISANASRGCNVPWTSDSTVAGTYASNGSPPNGWLTGPGGTADVNEWPTTGFNYGTPTIQPMYPLLDPIMCHKSIGSEGVLVQADDSLKPGSFRGSRPGLRGSEISGSWQILITNNISDSRYSTTASMGTYFRQARLELTYETPTWTRFKGINRYATRQSNDYETFSVSGSTPGSELDFWVNVVSVNYPSQHDIGRTFGLAPLTGTIDAQAALSYRLSGSLANVVGQVPSWLFTGQGGMPVIPESSASLIVIDGVEQRRHPFAGFLQPRRDLDMPQRLADVASDENPPATLRDLAIAFVSASTT